jgi:hypothetical protein
MHSTEWIRARKGGPKTESSFDYASRLTEGLPVGYWAQRFGKRIDWDAERMKSKGLPEADKLIHPQFRGLADLRLVLQGPPYTGKGLTATITR